MTSCFPPGLRTEKLGTMGDPVFIARKANPIRSTGGLAKKNQQILRLDWVTFWSKIKQTTSLLRRLRNVKA